MESQVVRAILESSTVQDVVKPQLDEDEGRPLVRATEQEKVLDVCTRLADSGVSSLPVFNDEDECIGLVDFSDAVAYLLQMDWERIGSVPNTTHVWNELGKVPVAEAIDLSTRNPMVFISENATLVEALKLFHDKGLRRALVQDDENGNVIAVLSPSAVIQYIMMNVQGRHDDVLSATVSELEMGHSPVRSVNKSQSVLEAMHLMHQTRHSVVAVVDPSTDVLSGSISMSDIQYVFQEKRFSLLISSCWKYIVEARERSDMEVFPYFGVGENDKLHAVISKLLATNVHHLYVVDENQVPQRVISFTDVCGILFKFCTSGEE
ncbi:Protein SDS23 [Hondaea fermentalgiana]|uniref:Protein SDS23 n=1 Tax=Hondaea fermentalgiana TaxID=2315210 RepID=A0A2R5GLU5_9STRA|nr:Protein SDS23 [Hondaea fermentalgiana]|eukprot:GBG31872.1 Protein SDS23 [Hondaea fermentalgiana]